eukprot:163665_1
MALVNYSESDSDEDISQTKILSVPEPSTIITDRDRPSTKNSKKRKRPKLALPSAGALFSGVSGVSLPRKAEEHMPDPTGTSYNTTAPPRAFQTQSLNVFTNKSSVLDLQCNSATMIHSNEVSNNSSRLSQSSRSKKRKDRSSNLKGKKRIKPTSVPQKPRMMGFTPRQIQSGKSNVVTEDTTRWSSKKNSVVKKTVSDCK